MRAVHKVSDAGEFVYLNLFLLTHIFSLNRAKIVIFYKTACRTVILFDKMTIFAIPMQKSNNEQQQRPDYGNSRQIHPPAD